MDKIIREKMQSEIESVVKNEINLEKIKHYKRDELEEKYMKWIRLSDLHVSLDSDIKTVKKVESKLNNEFNYMTSLSSKEDKFIIQVKVTREAFERNQ